MSNTVTFKEGTAPETTENTCCCFDINRMGFITTEWYLAQTKREVPKLPRPIDIRPISLSRTDYKH